MSRDDPRLVRLSILVARTVHGQGCHWTATGAQRCSCGLHALAQDVRDNLVAAMTRAEVEGLHAATLEGKVAALETALDLAHADRDHALERLAALEALHAGPACTEPADMTGWMLGQATSCDLCPGDADPCSVCGRTTPRGVEE